MESDLEVAPAAVKPVPNCPEYGPKVAPGTPPPPLAPVPPPEVSPAPAKVNVPERSLLRRALVVASLDPLASSLTVMVTISPTFLALRSWKREPLPPAAHKDPVGASGASPGLGGGMGVVGTGLRTTGTGRLGEGWVVAQETRKSPEITRGNRASRPGENLPLFLSSA